MTELLHHLKRARNGDREALRTVVEAWWPRMRRWALVATGDPVLAEDAVQEALVRVLRNIHRYDIHRPFGPWIRTVVYNASQDLLRQRGRAMKRQAPITGHESAPSQADWRLDLQRSALKALAHFQQLPARQRALIELVDLGGHTPTEAAAELGISASAARAQLCVARRAIREGLHREDPNIRTLLREA